MPAITNLTTNLTTICRPCPFCGSEGLRAEYDSTGTTLHCDDGCHGQFNFPASITEVAEMWRRNVNNAEIRRTVDRFDSARELLARELLEAAARESAAAFCEQYASPAPESATAPLPGEEE